MDSEGGVDMADFACAGGAAPQAQAVLRQQPADFQVVEQCPVTPADEGEHLWLWLEKTGLSTPMVAEQLAAAAKVRPRDVGYSGLKDRWAVTRQWFSLPWPIRHGDALPCVSGQLERIGATGSFRVLAQHRHSRKLRRSTHQANAFVITLRDVVAEPAAVEADLARVAQQGVPNYFGAQRFGFDGRNLQLARALFAGERLRRKQRGFALSAARGYLFNRLLDARVRAGSWNRLLPGEAVMLDGSHSVFAAGGENADDLAARLAAFDIHPSGPLPGRPGKSVPVSGHALALEQQVLAADHGLVTGLDAAGVDAARRALRVDTRSLRWRWPDASTLVVEMTLPPGSYATCVLREFVTTTPATGNKGITAI